MKHYRSAAQPTKSRRRPGWAGRVPQSLRCRRCDRSITGRSTSRAGRLTARRDWVIDPKSSGHEVDETVISYTTVYRWLHIVVATVVIWYQGVLRNAFERHGLESWATFGVIVIAIIALQAVEQTIRLRNRQTAMASPATCWALRYRGRLVGGGPDPAEPEKLSHVEYTRIRFEGGQYLLYGESWSLDGKSRGSFEAKDCNYNDAEKRLDFVFTTGPYLTVGGFGMWYFDRNEAPPNAFRCHYIRRRQQKVIFCIGKTHWLSVPADQQNGHARGGGQVRERSRPT